MTNIIPEHRRLPFDAEAAKRGEAVCTERGAPRFIAYDERRKNYPFYAIDDNDTECWQEDGSFDVACKPHCLDLRMVAPEETEAVSEDPATPAPVDPATLVPFDEARARKGEAVYLSDGVLFTPLKYDLVGKYNKNRIAGSFIEGGREYVEICSYVRLRMLPKEREKVWVVLRYDSVTRWWRVVGGPCDLRDRAIGYAKSKGFSHIACCEIEEIE